MNPITLLITDKPEQTQLSHSFGSCSDKHLRLFPALLLLTKQWKKISQTVPIQQFITN